MGPEARNVPLDRDPENDTFGVAHPMAVMIEQDHRIRSGQLLELGRRRARIRTQQRLRREKPLVLTVSVPESKSEKTQAMFRLNFRVHRKSNDDGLHGYVIHLVTDNENLVNASKLYARFQARGIVDK